LTELPRMDRAASILLLHSAEYKLFSQTLLVVWTSVEGKGRGDPLLN